MWPDLCTPPTYLCAASWRGKVVQQRPLSLTTSHCMQQRQGPLRTDGPRPRPSQACGRGVYRGRPVREARAGVGSPWRRADNSPAEPEGRNCAQQPRVEWSVCPCRHEPTCCAGCGISGFGSVVDRFHSGQGKGYCCSKCAGVCQT